MGKNSFTRVPAEDVQFYIRLKPGEHLLATHYALIPTIEPGFRKGWEDVVYLREPKRNVLHRGPSGCGRWKRMGE